MQKKEKKTATTTTKATTTTTKRSRVTVRRSSRELTAARPPYFSILSLQTRKFKSFLRISSKSGRWMNEWKCPDWSVNLLPCLFHIYFIWNAVYHIWYFMQYKRENFRVLLLHTCTPQVGVQKSFFAAQHRPVEKENKQLIWSLVFIFVILINNIKKRKNVC